MSRQYTIRINQGRIISLWLRILIVALLFVGILFINLYFKEEVAIVLSIFLAAPVLPFWNAFNLLEVDNQSRSYFKGFWLAGFKRGVWKSYEAIREIKIKDSGMNPSGKSTKYYKAYLIFENLDQIYLIGHNSQEKLKEQLKEIYKKLDLENKN
ncbi:MAG: hypothetical protein ACFHWX_17410 [Bacteroidota bacterium]